MTHLGPIGQFEEKLPFYARPGAKYLDRFPGGSLLEIQHMSGLTFTDEAARHLEKTYSTKDIVAQRLETIRHLNLSAGERVLDVGCGPGFLCEQMGEIVGRCGAVVGIDGCFEIVGGALLPPASAENDATQAQKCWISA
jgi:2-polyprenyl-3-methyl-5-hydroxy-6-metoxy-1,4-benzoquinol methylase